MSKKEKQKLNDWPFPTASKMIEEISCYMNEL